MATIYHGVDVAYYQGTINWTSVAAAKDFAVIKASGGDIGSFYTDPQFSTNQAGARAAGLKIGYYHFGSNGLLNPFSEADYFVSTVGSLNTGEALFLDAETFLYNGANYAPNNTWSYNFLSEVLSKTGFKCNIYMNYSTAYQGGFSSNYWGEVALISYLWLADWGFGDNHFGLSIEAWGNSNPNYPFLQYSDSGSVSGIPNTVDLDSFYSPNNTLNDWNIYGKPGAGPTPPSPTVPGVLTHGIVTQPDITYTEPSTETINVPTESYDQVLFSDTFKASVTASSWPQTVTGPNTGVDQLAYPIGNYSYTINGGPSLYNDFGFIFSGGFGQFPGDLPVVVVQPIVDAEGNLTFSVTVNEVPGTITVSLTINIALIAYPNTQDLDVTTVQQVVARSNAYNGQVPNDYSTYRRIAQDLQLGTGGKTTAHNQSTIPNILFWGQANDGTIEPQPVVWGSNGADTSHLGVSMDSSNIYTFVDSANNEAVWIRIYKDN